MKILLASTLVVLAFSSTLHAIAPIPIGSNLTVEVKHAGTMPKGLGDNIASPQPYGPHELFLISHVPTNIHSFNTKTNQITPIYDPSQTPAGIIPAGGFAMMNVAGNHAKNKVYMVFTSSTLPSGIPIRNLPDPDTDPSGGREDFLFIDTFNPALGFGNGNGGSGPLLNRDIYNIDAPDYTLFFAPSPLRSCTRSSSNSTTKRGH